MAAADVNRAFVYALKSIGKPGLELHKEQEEALSSVYEGQDTFVWLPTGFGKSICYESLPFLYDFTWYALRSNFSQWLKALDVGTQNIACQNTEIPFNL